MSRTRVSLFASRRNAAIAAVVAICASLLGTAAPASAANMAYTATTYDAWTELGGPSGFAQDGDKLFVSMNGAAGTARIWDTVTHTYTKIVARPWSRTVRVAGASVFVVAGSGIAIYDKSLNVQSLIGGTYESIAINGSHIFIGGSSGGVDYIKEYDVSDPTAPVLVQSVTQTVQQAALEFDGTHLWSANYGDNTVTVYDPANLSAVKTFFYVGRPAGLAFANNTMYVSQSNDSTIYAYNISTYAKLWQATAGSGNYDIYADSHAVWVPASSEGKLYQVSLAGANVATYTTGDQPYSADGDGTQVWTGNNRGMSFTLLQLVPVPTASKSTIEVEKSSLINDGTSQSTVTVTVNDSDGNPIANSPVCITLDSGTGTLSSGPWTTDSKGQVTATLTSAAAAGSGTVKATFGTCASPGDSIGTKTVKYVAPPDATKSTVTASPTLLKADGTAFATVTATVNDTDGAAMADMDVCFTIDSGKGTLSGGPWHTDANGQAKATLTSVNAGDVKVKVTLGTCEAPGASIDTKTITYFAYAVAANSTITADKTEIDADGKAKAKVTVTVKDQEGNPFPNQPVCIGVTDGTGKLTVIGTATSDAKGQVHADLLSATAVGYGTVSASFDFEGCLPDAIGSVTVNYVHYAGTNTELTVSQTEVPADGESTADVEFTLIDETGAPMAGVEVCLATTAGTLSAGPWTTDADGKVTATLTAPAFAREATVTAHKGACGSGGAAYAFARVTFVSADDSNISTTKGGSGGGTLPRTGSSPWLPLLTAMLLLVAGVAARRSRFAELR